MTTLKYSETPSTRFRPGGERRLGCTDHMMMVVVDFSDGPQSQPDPPHSHPHEQVSYVAEGEIIFVMEGQQTRLGPGDMFLVPSACTAHHPVAYRARPADRLFHTHPGGFSKVRAAILYNDRDIRPGDTPDPSIQPDEVLIATRLRRHLRYGCAYFPRRIS